MPLADRRRADRHRCALPASAPACFETFPHAIAWHLRGALLEQAGINTAALNSIDFIDAALCALAAHQLASARPCRAYGEPGSGLIEVPQGPDWGDGAA